MAGDSPDTVTRRFNRLVDAAGARRIRLHDIRHTYSTLAMDAGMGPETVSNRVGHADMTVTFRVYTHRSTGRDRDAAEKIAGLIEKAEAASRALLDLLDNELAAPSRGNLIHPGGSTNKAALHP